MVLITLAQMSQMIFLLQSFVVWGAVCFNRQHACPQHLPTWPSSRGLLGPSRNTERDTDCLDVPDSVTREPVSHPRIWVAPTKLAV